MSQNTIKILILGLFIKLHKNLKTTFKNLNWAAEVLKVF